MRIYYVLSEVDEEFNRESPLFSSLEKAQQWAKENKSQLLSISPNYYFIVKIVSEAMDGKRRVYTEQILFDSRKEYKVTFENTSVLYSAEELKNFINIAVIQNKDITKFCVEKINKIV